MFKYNVSNPSWHGMNKGLNRYISSPASV